MRYKKTEVLVVDDDRSLLKFIRVNLQARGFDVLTARDGAEALSLLADRAMPDLIILDLMMPGVDGSEVCRQVRAVSEVPIIVLSAIDDEERKVEALDIGADDYLTKPFGLQELLARVRAVLRRVARSQEANAAEPPFRCGNVEADFASHRLWVAGTEVYLTPLEFDLLRMLVRHAGKVLTHDMLLAWVWGDAYRGSNQYLHIYIGRLRQKLAAARGMKIVTYPGVGYLLQRTDG